MFFTQGCSQLGIPTSSSRKERVWTSFPHFDIWRSLSLQLQHYFCSRLTLCCWEQQQRNLLSHSFTSSSVDILSIIWRSGRGESRLHFISLAPGQTLTISHSVVKSINCVIFRGSSWESHLCLIGVFFTERDQNFS